MPFQWHDLPGADREPAERTYGGRPAPPWPAPGHRGGYGSCLYCASASSPCCAECPRKDEFRRMVTRAPAPAPRRRWSIRSLLLHRKTRNPE